MPNRSSKAGHIPFRTCVVCRNKEEKDEMIRFAILDGDIVIDWKQRLNLRGHYTCNNNACILRLDKWLIKHLKKIKRN